MRATRSDDTIIDGAFIPDKYIARVVPAGFAGADLFVLGDLRLGACPPSRASISRSRAARSTSRSRTREAHVDRAGAPDAGAPPGCCSTPSRRCRSELEGATPRTSRGWANDWSSRRGPRRTWPELVAGSTRSRASVVDAMSVGRQRHVPHELERLPRRACGVPPGEHGPRARDRREDSGIRVEAVGRHEHCSSALGRHHRSYSSQSSWSPARRTRRVRAEASASRSPSGSSGPNTRPVLRPRSTATRLATIVARAPAQVLQLPDRPAATMPITGTCG